MLSIIIPTLNEEKYLPLLLDSIRKQDFRGYEIIVADAGSKDKTVSIANEYGCKVVKGGLLPVGRNRGAEAARGETLLFLDSDVILYHPSFLTNVLKEVYDKNLGCAGFPLMPLGGNMVDKIAFGIWSKWAQIMQKILPHAASAILAQKKVHDQIGGFNEEIVFIEDLPYARVAGKVSKFGFIKKEPVFVSLRRYKKDGRLKTYVKYVLGELHIIFLGPIKSDIFRYKFGHYKDDSSKSKSQIQK